MWMMLNSTSTFVSVPVFNTAHFIAVIILKEWIILLRFKPIDERFANAFFSFNCIIMIKFGVCRWASSQIILFIYDSLKEVFKRIGNGLRLTHWYVIYTKESILIGKGLLFKVALAIRINSSSESIRSIFQVFVWLKCWRVTFEYNIRFWFLFLSRASLFHLVIYLHLLWWNRLRKNYIWISFVVRFVAKLGAMILLFFVIIYIFCVRISPLRAQYVIIIIFFNFNISSLFNLS